MIQSKENLKILAFQLTELASFDQITYYTYIANFIYCARTLLQISQTDFAKSLGFSQKYVSQVENVKKHPNAYDISIITKFLTTRIEEKGYWDLLESALIERDKKLYDII